MSVKVVGYFRLSFNCIPNFMLAYKVHCKGKELKTCGEIWLSDATEGYNAIVTQNDVLPEIFRWHESQYSLVGIAHCCIDLIGHFQAMLKPMIGLGLFTVP